MYVYLYKRCCGHGEQVLVPAFGAKFYEIFDVHYVKCTLQDWHEYTHIRICTRIYARTCTHTHTHMNTHASAHAHVHAPVLFKNSAHIVRLEHQSHVVERTFMVDNPNPNVWHTHLHVWHDAFHIFHMTYPCYTTVHRCQTMQQRVC